MLNHRCQDGQNITGIKLNKVIWAIDEDSFDMKFPDSGILEFDFFEVKRMPTSECVVLDEQLPFIIRGIEGQNEGGPRLDFLRILSQEKVFHTSQLKPILKCFLEPHYKVQKFVRTHNAQACLTDTGYSYTLGKYMGPGEYDSTVQGDPHIAHDDVIGLVD